MITHLPINAVGRDWFVGDIHGELELLTQLLADVRFDPSTDRLISVGDLVDRGPDCLGVLRLFDQSPWFHAIFGNHDAMALAVMSTDDAWLGRQWLNWGGEWYQALTRREQNEAKRILASLHSCFEVSLIDGRRIGVIHAEIPPGGHWQDMVQFDPKIAIQAFHSNWAGPLLGRERCTTAEYVHSQLQDFPQKPIDASMRRKVLSQCGAVPGIDWVVAGHTALMEAFGSTVSTPLAAGNCMFIDTGSGYPEGRLTVVDFANQEYAQVGAGVMRRGIISAPEMFQPLDLSQFR